MGPGHRVVRRVEAGVGEPPVMLEAGLGSPAGHLVVDGTGHNIPRDRPDVVADRILTVAAQAQASGG